MPLFRALGQPFGTLVDNSGRSYLRGPPRPPDGSARGTPTMLGRRK